MERKFITDKNKFVGIALTEHELVSFISPSTH